MTRILAAALHRSIAAPAGVAARSGAAGSHPGPDPRIDEALKLLLAVGAVLVLLLPAARGSVSSIGWLPMWLLGMPLVALWALRGFPVPSGRRAAGPIQGRGRRVRAKPQARRRARATAGSTHARATA